MNKQYEIKYENKSIFFNGNLDYLFNALHDDKEPNENTGDDIISLANFISSDDKEIIKRKSGRLKKEPKELNKQKKPRGRPHKPPITTAMMQARLIDMVNNII